MSELRVATDCVFDNQAFLQDVTLSLSPPMGRSTPTFVTEPYIGYQYGTAYAFALYTGGSGLIDTPYVDSLSVTHGQPGDRTHIWTFVNPDTVTVPSYVVGDKYFCDLETVNPLWDGDGCGPNSYCCSFNLPPSFTVELPTPTTDDIEVRNFGDEGTDNEDVGIQLIEFYIR